MPTVTLLGPQRLSPNVGAALDRAGVDGSVVSVTAGWRDAEGEIGELAAAVARPVADLGLYARTASVLAEDSVLAVAHRERQAALTELQHLYRIRLRHALEALRELDAEEGDSPVLRDQRRAALAQLRLVDRQQRRQILAIHRAFEARVGPPASRPSVQKHRAELLETLAGASAVLIAGGHVAVLLNRLRLFDIAAALSRLPLVAWSAGAMCLGSHVVLFHDNAPEGPRAAEIMDTGLAILPGVLPLPHASERLRLDDRERLSLFARRFAPTDCLTFERGSLACWADGRLAYAEGVTKLTRRGRLRPARPT